MIKLKPQTNHKCVNLKSYSVGFCTLKNLDFLRPRLSGKSMGIEAWRLSRTNVTQTAGDGTANFLGFAMVCCNQ